jgi:hypothetical protein
MKQVHGNEMAELRQNREFVPDTKDCIYVLLRPEAGPHPHSIIVVGTAACGSGLVGTRQRIDTTAIFMGGVGPDTLDDQRALLLTGM